jgi:CGNR zinc finger
VNDVLAPEDEALLLELLNSTPVGESGVEDALGVDDAASAWGVARGGSGSSAETAYLRETREMLQQVLWGRRPASDLTLLVSGFRWEPRLDQAGLHVQLRAEDGDRLLAGRAVLTWGLIARELPGRLRACANDDCRLFLLDRSRANTARWCSMAICGNRMKARRHYQRTKEDSSGPGSISRG